MRASNTRQCELCPGSEKAQKGKRDIKTKESRQGDRLHDYYAHPEYERALLPPEEQDLLRTADQLTEQIYDVIGLDGDYVEQREVFMGDEEVGGHPDRIRVYGGSKENPQGTASIIIDAKFGWMEVDKADVNLQTRVYAILTTTPDVYVAIMQPRLYENKVTIARYGPKSKAAAYAQIYSIYEGTQQPDAPLIPGEEQCRFCKARATCPALRKAITTQLANFEDLAPDFAPELSKAKVRAIIEARLKQATDEQVAQLYSACALGRIVQDPVGDEIRERIKLKRMKGWSVANDFEARNIKNASRAASLLALGRILPREKAMALCTMSVVAVEELYRKESKVTAKQAKADINKALESVIEKEPRKGKIIKP